MGADKNPEEKPIIILRNRFISLFSGFIFSLNAKKIIEKNIVITEKNRIKLAVFKLAAYIAPKITPKITNIPKVFTILKSTAWYFMCVIVEIIDVGIMIEKEVPTAKCIINSLSIPIELKI
jgi:hypothetical protein